jgi:hypothetical protein
MKGKTYFLETKFPVSLSYEVWGLRRLWVTVSTALVARTTLPTGLPAQLSRSEATKIPARRTQALLEAKAFMTRAFKGLCLNLW